MADIIKGINFRKIEADTSVASMLRDISMDVEASTDPAGAEMFALVRYADGSYDIWSSKVTSALMRIGELEVLKYHLIERAWGDEGS